MTLIEKIDYLFSKINWKASFLDANAIRYMNEIKETSMMLSVEDVKIALKQWVQRHEEYAKNEPYIKYSSGKTKSLNEIIKEVEDYTEEGQRFIQNILSVAITSIQANRPKEPPKLRRMSELPEFKRVNIKVDRFSAKNNSGSFWIIGSKRIDRAGNIVIESKFATFRFEAGVYLNNEHGAKLTGWLPLPNPNNITL